MAKPKKTSKAKSSKKPAPKAKSAPKKAVAAKASGGGGGGKKTSEAARILASWPPITDVERAAFNGQYRDDKCQQLGARTQSDAVRNEAVGFARVIDGALRKFPQALRRYGASRFVYFLESIVALERTRAESSDKGAGAARNSLDHSVSVAKASRRDLLHALEQLTGDSDVEQGSLDDARGHGEKPSDLVESLHALARLADGWLRRTDGESKALVASLDLQRGDVDHAWGTADDLDLAIQQASGERRSGGKDSRDVNIVEGRVLLEMRYAMRAFAHARESAAGVPALNAGAGTRGVLVSHNSSSKNIKNGAAAAPTATPS